MEHKYVELGAWDKITHYSIVGFFLVITATSSALVVLDPGAPKSRFLLGIFVVSLLLAGIFYWRQRRALRFVKFHTHHDAKFNFHAVLSLTANLEWNVIDERHAQLVVAAVPGFPKTLRSWGARVTVCFSGTDVYVNSICDPAKGDSVVTFGRNSENVRAVAKAVNGSSLVSG